MNIVKQDFGFRSKLINDEYYDMSLVNSHCQSDLLYNGNVLYDNCLITEFDFTNASVYSGNTNIIYSNSGYTYNNSKNYGLTLNYIGLTGIDNGTVLLSGNTNDDIMNAYSGSVLTIDSGITQLILHQVTGFTGDYVYPIQNLIYDNNSGNTFNYKQFNGGFYQGFFKSKDNYNTYQVLPTRPTNEWGFEFWLNKNELNYNSGNTLNEKYPENKGIILYIGARAEDKFYNTFSGETGYTLYNGMQLPPPIRQETITDNKFMLFNRTENGLNTCNFNNDVDYVITANTKSNSYEDENYFTVFDRTTSGETVCSFLNKITNQDEINYLLDIVDNNFCVQIKDNGSIGYKILTSVSGLTEITNVTGLTITEEFSPSGLITNNDWQHLFIRFIPDCPYDYCQLENNPPSRNIKLYFYIDGKLKFITKSFKEPLFKDFQNNKEKVQGVPYNISIGGGTQGLIDTLTINGVDEFDKNLPIEQNFAGTFIGAIAKFRFYDDCKMDYTKIYNNFKLDRNMFNDLEIKREDPLFATTINIENLTEQINPIITDKYIEIDFVAETITNKQTIDIPKNKYPNVTGIEMFNPLSNTWLWLSGNKNNSLNTFDKTIIFRNINNQSIEYYRFMHRGSKIGSRKLRFTIS